MFLFFVAYLYVLRHPAHPVTTVPVTAIDVLVPFYPPSLLIYASLWLYVSLPPALLLGLRELVAYGFWITGLCIAGLLIFYFWPTTLTPYPIDRGQYWGFDVLQGVDAATNACPSLHVATAAFSFYWFDRVFKEMNVGVFGRVFNMLWFVAIAYSTMATKQHVFVDVVAGFAFGTAFALPSLWYRKGVTWEAYQRQRLQAFK
ncbi:MAG TPA: phosphatase PAP2 family protein [Burkholderiales bacterium]|nr:phosphatase PAP2 family protein [Burkholderiales bacterium]